jgi:hypothetical protein
MDELEVLKSIDASLKRLVDLSSQRLARASMPQGSQIAPESDLLGQYGDEKIKTDPRDWSKESYKGRKMSEAPAEFLDMYAETMEYFARKNDEKGEKSDKGVPKSQFDRRSAARSRGWAARIRSGLVEQKPEPESDFGKGGAW